MKAYFALVLLGCTLCASAEIETKEVTYPAGKVEAKGFLATPAEEGPHPGVLIVHEWWGHNDYARKRAKMLAELGYAALAVDMYGSGKTANHPRDATAYMMEVSNNMPEMASRFLGAMKFLQAQPKADKEKIAAMGYCFGGNVVLQMARNGLPGLAGVASFHGALKLREPNPPIDKISAKILVCNGAEDPFIRPEQKEDFKALMKKLNADMKFIDYENALHSFTNPDATAKGKKFNIPLVYDPKADAASWAELTRFLEDLFSPEEKEPKEDKGNKE